jgi:hypothetical protein
MMRTNVKCHRGREDLICLPSSKPIMSKNYILPFKIHPENCWIAALPSVVRDDGVSNPSIPSLRKIITPTRLVRGKFTLDRCQLRLVCYRVTCIRKRTMPPRHRRVPTMVMILPRVDLGLFLYDLFLSKRIRGSLKVFFSSLSHRLQVLRIKAPKRTIAIAQICSTTKKSIRSPCKTIGILKKLLFHRLETSFQHSN